MGPPLPNKVLKNEILSHGLPWLAAKDSHIVRADTYTPVLLCGVNRSGLEYSEPKSENSAAGTSANAFLDAAGIHQQQVCEMVEGWGANILRVPFNQDWALHGRNQFSAESYLNALDQVIDWAAALGAYTLLDLQWLDADLPYGHLTGGADNFVAPLPNSATIDLWVTLAQRYQNEPAVLFDLFNEPHNRLKDDPHPLYLMGENGVITESNTNSVGPAEWLPWARRLVDVIRAVHPRSLIWVSGVDWAFDLRGIELDVPNLIYSAHVYANRPRWQWGSRFGRMSVDRPLFIGEFGGGENDCDWGARLLAYIGERACGWTAWSWSDYPRLVKNAQAGDYTPTPFGVLVRDSLKSS